jgi:hypothetical protein
MPASIQAPEWRAWSARRLDRPPDELRRGGGRLLGLGLAGERRRAQLLGDPLRLIVKAGIERPLGLGGVEDGGGVGERAPALSKLRAPDTGCGRSRCGSGGADHRGPAGKASPHSKQTGCSPAEALPAGKAPLA